jgi:superfamily II DNA or RNA helicase
MCYLYKMSKYDSLDQNDILTNNNYIENNKKIFEKNSTDFLKKTETYFTNLKYNSKEEYLQYHQFIINKYMIDSNTRGLLLYHEMGYGKSILAASIVESYKKIQPNRNIILLMPKSLQENMKNAINKFNKYSSNNNEYISNKNKYTFISLNASNMYTQLSNVNKTKEELEFEKSLEKLNERLDNINLENSLIIIDEYHNLSNSITNGSKNALNFYNKIIDTKNIKLIFLTGTPIINHPFELVCTFNMLTGFYNKKLLFPENFNDFIKFFINLKDNTIKNKEKFQNRIMGLVSYYGTKYFDEDRPNFPKQLPLKIEKIPMSRLQFLRYGLMREIEKKEESNKFKNPNQEGQFNIKSEIQSSYRIRSRQISNFLIPNTALTEHGNKAPIKHINKITNDVYKNLNEYSPKFNKIIENIKKHKNQLALVYSQFVSAEGLYLFSKCLEYNGYELWNDNNVDMEFNKKNDDMEFNKKNDDIEFNKKNNNIEFNKKNNNIEFNKKGGQEYQDDLEYHGGDLNDPLLDDLIEYQGGNKLKNKNKLKYAIISGEILPSHRERIKNVFNSNENKYGRLISILLISQSGAEGLDLKNIRSVHIMEPFWNWARSEQVIARAVRYLSHEALPKNEQNVQPYIYLSTYPDNYKIQKDEELTTDESIYISSQNNRKLRDEFLLSLREVSIDCNTHKKNIPQKLQNLIKCYSCLPTHEELYNIDFYTDMNESNPCKKITEKKIKTNEIILKIEDKEIKYYYTKDNDKIKIFEYSKDLGGYIPMSNDNPYYSIILRKILKL